jgi:ABC-type multidrug transport system ATPase subunit
MNSVLNIINANKNFDGTIALDDFSLEVPKNSIIGIIVSGHLKIPLT